MFNYDSLKHDIIVDETWFSDPIFCEEKKEWYALSKTLAETATWKYAEENGLDFVTRYPGLTIGRPLQPTLNSSCVGQLNVIKGKQLLPNGVYRYVDVRDVALAHVVAYENASASGRYCLVGSVAILSDALDILKQIFPALNLPPIDEKNRPTKLPYQVSKEKAESLGVSFRPLDETLKDSWDDFIAMYYYVVWVGRAPGIYRNWPDCQKQILNFKGAVYKKYPSLEAAEEAICKPPPHSPQTKPPSQWNTEGASSSSDAIKLTITDEEKTIILDGGVTSIVKFLNDMKL